MFEVGENADGILAGVLFLIWLSAAILATRLAWRPTPEALRKSARRLLRLLVAALVVLVVKCVAIGLMLAVDWIFADNRVIVQMPLLLLPMLAVVIWTVPGLRALADRDDAPIDVETRSAAADPRFVVPVQVTAVATVIGVYFAYVSRPVPSYLDDIATHAAPILLSVVVLWFWQGGACGSSPRPTSHAGAGVPASCAPPHRLPSWCWSSPPASPTWRRAAGCPTA